MHERLVFPHSLWIPLERSNPQINACQSSKSCFHPHWLEYLHMCKQLVSVSLWPCREVISYGMAPRFLEKYRKYMVIIDGTESNPGKPF